MPRVCTICAHEDRQKIDQSLALSRSIRETSALFRVSEDALTRHKTHVAQAIVKAAAKHEESIGESIHARLESLFERGRKTLDEAERSGDHRLVLAAIRELRETLAGMFALAVKGMGAEGGLGAVPTDDLKKELVRRGEHEEIIVTITDVQ